MVSGNAQNTTVLYPDEFLAWDDASRFLSDKLQKAVFSLHVHDGDLWMFVLFDRGKEIGRFNPIPDYWGELSLEEKLEWRGDAATVAGVAPGVSADSIARYLSEWDLEDENPEQAYSGDEFTYGDCWQVCDFMRRIGLGYPLRDDGTPDGTTYRLWTGGNDAGDPASTQPNQRSRNPWWKFW